MATTKSNATKALVKHDEPETQQLATQSAALPEYLREAPKGPIQGAENVNTADIIMPRLAVCSKNTPQYDENNEKYIENLELGMFFNTITREVFGTELWVTPLFELNTRARFRPYEEKGAPYCVSFDGKTGEGDPGGNCLQCEFAQWGSGKNGKRVKPGCTKSLNFALLVMPATAKLDEKANTWNTAPRLETISICGFKSTAFPQGQEWITMLQLRNRHWFTTVFKLTAAARSDGKNSWYIPLAENAGWLPEQATQLTRPCYESIHEMYSSGRLKVDEQEAEEVPS